MPWMTDLWNNALLAPLFQNRPLRAITIPGTHDAGCYVVQHGWMGSVLSRTQSHTIAQQLAGGIRYFDVRPKRFANGSVFTYHGPSYVGGRLDGNGGILDDVAQFMAGLGPGDRELVILNISHFSGFDATGHGLLVAEIMNRLGPHLVPHTQAQIDLFEAPYGHLLTDPTVGLVRSRVAILYDGALDTGAEAYVTGQANAGTFPIGFFVISPKYTPTANAIRLFDQYANKRWLDDGYLYTGMRSDQLDKLRNRGNYVLQAGTWIPWAAPVYWPPDAVGGVASTLHLFSWTLTPQRTGSDPITVAQNESNPALPALFSNATAGWAGGGGNYDPAADLKINIIYVDDYASHTYNNPLGSPFNGVAVPVAFAARLNVGPIWPMNW